MPCLWKTIAAITLLYYSGANGNQPRITGPAELVIETGKNFSLTCLSDGEPRWSLPSFSHFDTGEDLVYYHDDAAGQSILNVVNPHFLNTGYYSCEREGQPPARVYVYISDPDHPLVSNQSIVFVTGHIGENISLPCRPSSPHVNVTLSDEYGIVFFHPHVGFILEPLEGTNIYISCYGSSNNTEDHLIFAIDVQEKRDDKVPVPIILSDDLVAIQVGQDFNMTCEVTVDSAVRFNLNWHLPHDRELDGRVKESTTVRKKSEILNKTDELDTWVRVLTIKGAQKEDQGDYTCTVGVEDLTNSVTHHLLVHSPEETFLNLTVHKPDIDVRTGSAYAQWMGALAAHPHADLIWTNSTGGALYNSSKYEITRTGTKFRLTINDITAADAGRYFLTARNETLALKLTVSGKPSVLLNVPELFEVGSEVNITCMVLGYPEPKVVWLRKDCDLLIDRNCDQADAVPVSGDLITEFRLENRVQSILQLKIDSPGELICSAENEEGSSREMSRLKVTDVPEGFIVQTPEEIVQGDTVFFFCRADLYSISNDLKWYFAKNESEIQEPIVDNERVSLKKIQGFYSSQLRLQIKNITMEDNGLYACQGTLQNRTTVEEVVHITVHEPRSPVISKSNLNGSTVIVEKLEPIVWRCYVSGMPTPTVQWFHNGEQIVVDNSSELVLNDENQTLTLLRLSPQDEGKYACRVSNRYGSESAEINLQILKKVRLPFYVLLAIIVVAAVMLFITTYLIWRLCKERKRRKELSLAGLLNFKDGAVDAINPALTLQEQADLLPYHSKWEFPRNRLTLGKQLGAGTFGVVHKAEAKGIDPAEPSTTVAVKMVKRHSDPATVRDLASELKIMAHLGRHPHVVNLLGAVTTKLAERELLLIVEFCRFGNVRNYILSNMNRFVDQLNPATGQLDLNRARIIGYERNRIHFANVPFARSIESEQFSGASHDTQSTLVSSLSPRDMISGDYHSEEVSPLSTSVLIGWSFQIARGMEWLASRKVLHGDLAARNILLADGNIVKICDFGLARSIYSSPEYQKTAKGPLPIKWMAVESIRSGIFSTQSDVWSYGVVLWELFSLARTPYPGFDNRSVLQMLSDGYRMEKPEFAPQRLYDFMLECWNVEPAKRPSFTDLACKLGVLLEDSEREHYLELEEEYRQKDNADAHDYLSMVKAPNFDEGNTYVNIPSTPGYVEMDGENHELKPMLQPSSDDYLTPRDVPFESAAVSNPSYEITLQKPSEKVYGKVGKSSVRENINLFESFRKKH